MKSLQIVRCLKRDMGGDLQAAAKYAEAISRNASMNPWSPSEDVSDYADAAKLLRDELSNRVADDLIDAL